MLLALKQRGGSYRRFRSLVDKDIRPLRPEATDPLALNVGSFKKSDTLFVLASGSSINRLDGNQWKTISSADSLGINFWLYHDFVPTWYLWEIPRSPESAKVLIELLRLKLHAYERTCCLLKDAGKLSLRYANWKEELPLRQITHLYTLCNLHVSGRTESGLRLWLKLYRALGYFQKQEILWGIPMKRASLFQSLAFGLMAGYRRIILCGVDLNHGDYFYQAPLYREKGLPQLAPSPTSPNALAALYSERGMSLRGTPNPQVHNTMDKALNPLPIDRMVHALHEVVLKPEGVELYTAFSSSALHPRIPAFWT
jgi:hypothetical protein